MKKLLRYTYLSLNMDKFPTGDRVFIWYGIYTARTVYAQYWRDKETPPLERWISKLSEVMGMDSFSKYLRNQNKKEFKSDGEIQNIPK